MKKILLMLAIMGSVVTTASAKQEVEDKELQFYEYYFEWNCKSGGHIEVFDHELSNDEYMYLKGYYDATCSRFIYC